MTVAELLAFVITAVLAANAWVTTRSTVRKNDFDALCRIVDELTEAKDRLSKEIKEIRIENAALRIHNRMLANQVVSLGGIPVPMPEQEKKDD